MQLYLFAQQARQDPLVGRRLQAGGCEEMTCDPAAGVTRSQCFPTSYRIVWPCTAIRISETNLA